MLKNWTLKSHPGMIRAIPHTSHHSTSIVIIMSPMGSSLKTYGKQMIPDKLRIRDNMDLSHLRLADLHVDAVRI